MSFPEIRNFIRDQFVKVISNEYQNPEVIAGVATGGIAIGALIAQALDLPFIYVRSEAKKHGLGNQIEGVLEAGQKVIVIEDLISTGNSSLNAVHALRERGAQVEGMIAIFTYGFDKAKANFIDANCKLSTLTEYDTLLKEALHSNYISPDQLQALQSWRKNPEAWSASFQTSLS